MKYREGRSKVFGMESAAGTRRRTARETKAQEQGAQPGEVEEVK
jgi:hypothetical protein